VGNRDGTRAVVEGCGTEACKEIRPWDAGLSIAEDGVAIEVLEQLLGEGIDEGHDEHHQCTTGCE
jgi:hypothetical protein